MRLILSLVVVGILTAASALAVGSRLEGIEFTLPASDQELTAAASAIPLSRPAAFNPVLAPGAGEHMIATYKVGPEFSGYSATEITSVLTRRMRPAFRRAGLPVPDVESPLECEDPLCSASPRFHITILLPRPDEYFASLTVEVGNARGTWSVTRPLSALNFHGNRPNTTNKPYMVMTSILNDLDIFATEACENMIGRACNSENRE